LPAHALAQPLQGWAHRIAAGSYSVAVQTM